MSMTGYLILYCLLIIATSLLGGMLPMAVRFTHRRMQIGTSLVAGFMLGIALLHLLPHALLAAPVQVVVGWMVAGLLVMFFLERFFAYHHHDAPGEVGRPPVTADAEPVEHCDVAPGDPIDHAHGHAHGHQHGHELTWSGAAVGLILHSVIAGIALAASMQAETHGNAAWPGLAVFLVIVLHKPFDSMTLLTLVVKAGYRKSTGHLINGLFALAVPLGAVLLLLGLGSVDVEHSVAVGGAVAFAAGVFLCVSLSDLLPELQFHRHDRVKLSLALLLGLALAWTIAHFEAETHQHDEHDAIKHNPDHHDHAHE